MFVSVINNMVDTALVGHLGNSALAAVGSAGFFVWLLFSVMDIFAIGTVAIVSRNFGAGKHEEASENCQHIFRFAAVFSSLLAIVGVFYADRILDLLNLAPDVELLGETYIRIVFLAIPMLFISEVGWSVFRSVGDTKTPMLIMIGTVATNLILDIFLIYGVWIFPRLEVTGAAIATAASHTFGGLLGIYLIHRGKIPFKVIPRNLFPINFKIVGKMAKIGLPISTAGFIFTSVYLVMTRIMAEFGTSAVASIPVGNRIESISYMTCHGFYMAVSAIVGQNIGAKRPERARSAVWSTCAMISGLTFMFGILFYMLPEQISSIFTEDSDVVRYASEYLKILAVSQVFMGFEFVFEGAFGGAGNTIPPTVVSIPGTLIRIPLAYYLAIAMGMGPSGIFWAITISTIIKGIAIMIWFKVGKWYKPEL
jgi:putative MATE family efflux protein